MAGLVGLVLRVDLVVPRSREAGLVDAPARRISLESRLNSLKIEEETTQRLLS